MLRRSVTKEGLKWLTNLGSWDRSFFGLVDQDGELYLMNAYIAEYKAGNRYNHETRRPRKLLLHKREINRLAGAIKRSGVTIVALKLYFNERGIAKVLLGLARGKRQHDKRATIKERDWKRDQARLIRERG